MEIKIRSSTFRISYQSTKCLALLACECVCVWLYTVCLDCDDAFSSGSCKWFSRCCSSYFDDFFIIIMILIRAHITPPHIRATRATTAMTTSTTATTTNSSSTSQPFFFFFPTLCSTHASTLAQHTHTCVNWITELCRIWNSIRILNQIHMPQHKMPK